ncbi:MAG: DUF4238 domain-containing protein [Bacteroidetes bacterium]|jgi:hypothetical protein|nr:DUF4238 domain-containing protein [Bacteroidota bacterium]MBT4337658.1 DUF4238 domain-containing protein [Bacteroidota bacterium]MBT7038794.1 DUF4238 domain-containing protein [Bacteroidota bacterium]MBT7993429.1 DUF4238 domain-containing protein [Bacteroidota bacterium]
MILDDYIVFEGADNHASDSDNPSFPMGNHIIGYYFDLVDCNEFGFSMDFTNTNEKVYNSKNQLVTQLVYNIKYEAFLAFKIRGIRFRIELIEKPFSYSSVIIGIGKGHEFNGRVWAFSIRAQIDFRTKTIGKEIKGKKRKQHYIPKVYLKQFSTDAKNLFIGITKQDKNSLTKISFEDNVFWRDFLYDYYGSDQYLEDWFCSGLEKKYNPIIRKIINTNKLNTEIKSYIIDFMCMLILRHPENINAWKAQEAKNLSLIRNVLPKGKYGELFSKGIQSTFNNYFKEYKALFESKSISILYPPNSRFFVSSDKAVSIKPAEGKRKIREIKGDILFPLTSKILVALSDDKTKYPEIGIISESERECKSNSVWL